MYDCSIEGYREVRLEGAAIDRVHIVCRTFVHAGVHLRRRIDLDLRFHSVVSDRPLVDLYKIYFYYLVRHLTTRHRE